MRSKISVGPGGWFLLAALVAVWACACSEETKGDIGAFCETDGDCKAGLVCENNTCVRPEETCAEDCAKWIQTCFDGECVGLNISVDDIDDDGWRRDDDPKDCDDFDWTINPDAHEVCDGVDNNCDGLIDEGCPYCENGNEQDCGTDIGVCTMGTQICSAGRWGACSSVQGPTPELCNGEDDDCDGLTDEVCPCHNGEKFTCSLDEGSCRAGTTTCIEGEWTPCIGGVAPEEEKCDGVDNDCDTLTDEGFNLDVPCTATGECGKGVIECAGEWGMRCSTAPGGSQDGSVPELCNDLDDDCDGTTDEGCACTGSESRSCGSDEGECQAGTQTCQGGQWGDCVGQKTGTQELCDGLDNDCDEATDEDFTDLGSLCQSDGFGCGEGELECTSDGLDTICSTQPGSPTFPMLLNDDFENFVKCNADSVLTSCWEILDEGEGDGSNWVSMKNEWWLSGSDTDDCTTQNEDDCWLVETSNIWGGHYTLRGTIAYWNDIDAMSWTDYRLKVTAMSRDNDGIGVVFGFQDESNCYRLLLRNDTAVKVPDCPWPKNCTRALYVIHDGVAQLIASSEDPGYVQNEEFTIEVEVKGNSIQIWKDGQQLFVVPVHSGHEGGTIGLYSLGNHAAHFDDVMVRQLCPE